MGAFLHHFPLKILACHVAVPVMSLGREAVLMFSKLTVGLLLLSVSHTTSTDRNKRQGSFLTLAGTRFLLMDPAPLVLNRWTPSPDVAVQPQSGKEPRAEAQAGDWGIAAETSSNQFCQVAPGTPQGSLLKPGPRF